MSGVPMRFNHEETSFNHEENMILYEHPPQEYYIFTAIDGDFMKPERLTVKVRGIHRPTCPEDWRKGFVKKFSSSHFEFSWEDDPSKCKCFKTFDELMTFLKTVTSGTKL